MSLELKPAVTFEDIKVQVLQYLDQHDTLDLSNISAVSLMVDAIAAGIEVSKFEVLRALQECFLQSAVLDDSIFQIIDMLHVQLVCKSPCFAEMTVSAPEQIRIPAYTQFKSGDIFVYNRSKATINAEATNIEVFEGKVIKQTMIVENNKPSMTLSYDDFRVSISDIVVKVGNTVWNKFDGDEYTLTADDRVFLLDVNYRGAVRIYFGTGVFGAIPPIGSEINISYTISNGIDGSQQVQGMKFTSAGYPTIEAYGVGSLLGGDNERDAAYLKEYGPWLSASKEWASRTKDYRAIASKFPGVVDCSVQNQAILAPGDRRWENYLQITLLTNDIWSDASWSKLETELKTKGGESMHFLRKDAVSVDVDFSFIVYCKSNAQLDSVKRNVETAIRTFLSPKPRCLGLTVRMADVEEVLRSSDDDIASFTRLYPNIDYENMLYYEYVLANDINIETRYE